MRQQTTGDANSTRILIVDDDPIFTSLASASLSVAGFQPRTATDGVEALEILESERFRLALIDLAMPRVDGFRLISLVRSTPRHDSMSIMVISARQEPEAFEEAHALGADGFLTKPIRWSLLPVHLRFLLHKRSPHSAN